MQFMVKAYDGEGVLEKRMEARPAHLKRMEELGSKVICGGGILDEEGKMKGSLLVIDFASKELLDEYLATEPYITEHVWEKVDVERMNVVILDNEKVGK